MQAQITVTVTRFVQIHFFYLYAYNFWLYSFGAQMWQFQQTNSYRSISCGLCLRHTTNNDNATPEQLPAIGWPLPDDWRYLLAAVRTGAPRWSQAPSRACRRRQGTIGQQWTPRSVDPVIPRVSHPVGPVRRRQCCELMQVRGDERFCFVCDFRKQNFSPNHRPANLTNG